MRICVKTSPHDNVEDDYGEERRWRCSSELADMGKMCQSEKMLKIVKILTCDLGFWGEKDRPLRPIFRRQKRESEETFRSVCFTHPALIHLRKNSVEKACFHRLLRIPTHEFAQS